MLHQQFNFINTILEKCMTSEDLCGLCTYLWGQSVKRKFLSSWIFFDSPHFLYLHKTPKRSAENVLPVSNTFPMENPFQKIFDNYDACTDEFYFHLPFGSVRFLWSRLNRILGCHLFVLHYRVVGFSAALGLITAFSTLGRSWIIMLSCCGPVIPLSTCLGANLNAYTIFNLHANGGEHFPSHLVVVDRFSAFSAWLFTGQAATPAWAAYPGVLLLSEVVVSVSQFPIK